MKSTNAFTDAKASLPTSSSGIETPKRSSTSTTSSSASIESRPSPSPKIGPSFAISVGPVSSRSPVTRSSFTSASNAFRSIAPRVLEHREATVHVDGGPGNIRRGRRREEKDHPGHLLRGAEATERYLALHRLARRCLASSDQPGVDVAGRHRVDGDAVARHLAGQRLGEGDEPTLRRRVARGPLLAEE